MKYISGKVKVQKRDGYLFPGSQKGHSCESWPDFLFTTYCKPLSFRLYISSCNNANRKPVKQTCCLFFVLNRAWLAQQNLTCQNKSYENTICMIIQHTVRPRILTLFI